MLPMSSLIVRQGRYLQSAAIPEPGKLFSCFGSGTEYYIRYCNIVRIGPDIVLVDIDACDIRKIQGGKE